MKQTRRFMGWCALSCALMGTVWGAYGDPADPGNWVLGNTVVVCGADNPLYDALNAEVSAPDKFPRFDTVTQAIAYAQSQNGAIQYIVVASSTAGTSSVVSEIRDNITYPQNETFSIVGYPPSNPETIVIKAADPSRPVLDLGSAPAGVFIEGLTFTGGSVGIRTGNRCAATINRCYIRDNNAVVQGGVIVDRTGVGILCEGGSVGAPIIQNCSIVHNECDGIRVESQNVCVAFCTIFENGRNGVSTVGGGKASVTSSIVMRNAIGDTVVEPITNFICKWPPADPMLKFTWSEAPGSQWNIGPPSGGGGQQDPNGFGNPDPRVTMERPEVFGVNLAGNYTASPDADADIVRVLNNNDSISEDVLIHDVKVTILGVAIDASSLEPTALVLETPAGNVTLAQINAGISLSLENVTFSDSAAEPFPASASLVNGDLRDGVYKPVQPLSALAGQSADGPWRVVLQSHVSPVKPLTCRIALRERFWLSVDVDCTNYRNVSMIFDRWLNVDAQGYAGIQGQVVGTNRWLPIWDKGVFDIWDRGDNEIMDGNVDRQQWTVRSYDLPWAGGKKIRVRWTYRTDFPGKACSGWNITNLRFVGIPTSMQYYGLNAAAPQSLTSLSNDVYANAPALWTPPTGTPCPLQGYIYTNAYDYNLNVSTDPILCKDIHVDPRFDMSSPWIGRLLARELTQCTDPVCIDVKNHSGTAPCPCVTPPRDFQYVNVRPDNECNIPDIGADEIPSDGGTGPFTGIWFACRVLDVQADPGPPQMVGAHSFTVDVWMTEAGMPDEAYYIAADGTQVDLGSATDAGGGRYTYRASPPASGGATDGEASVRLRYGNIVLGDGGPYDDLITAQAQRGRRFIIDTIPPVIVQPGPGYIAPVVVSASLSGNPSTAASVPFGSLTHPYDNAPSSYPQGGSQGAHGFTFASSADRCLAFFNIGSPVNGYDTPPPSVWDLELKAVFRDDPPSNRTVAVSGFRTTFEGGASAIELAPPDLAAWNTGGVTRPVWLSDTSVSAFPLASVTNTSQLDVAGSTDNITATWKIPLRTPIAEAFRATVRFAARDRAGNVAEPPLTSTGDSILPLEIWWLAPTVLDANLNVRTVPGAFPMCEWGLKRESVDIAFDSGPKPLYAYRIWAKNMDPSRNVYEPLDTWKPWSDQNMAVTPVMFEALQLAVESRSAPDITTLYGQSLLLVVAACDEAGNVSRWPDTLPPLGTGDTIEDLMTGDGGINWRRFTIPDKAKVVDTRLTASFRRAGVDLGAVTIMQAPDYGKPQDLQAIFTITLVVPEASALAESFVEVELIEDGKSVYTGELWGRPGADGAPMPDPVRRIVVPALDGIPAGALANGCLGHPHTPGVTPPDGTAVDYVFRATTKYKYLGKFISDASPATYKFKVVPRSVEQYLEIPAGQQPVKLFERE
ncbi:MAG TPA: right-handed parallel beta-helix repeat-containing protein [Candidatus Hydrogenedentes bacterium]|nr:right-handed parallel beta-helix repeat-containing protein [Candidatus Hydrogenedentota bacterium]